MKTVIFACVHSAGRSQIAAALFNHLANSSLARAVSAGTHPAARVHPEVVEVMREVGIDLSSGKPQLLTPELAKRATLLVTMGCGEECPFIPGLRRADWALQDPKGQSVDRVREIRDEIHECVRTLVSAEGWERTKPRSVAAKT